MLCLRSRHRRLTTRDRTHAAHCTRIDRAMHDTRVLYILTLPEVLELRTRLTMPHNFASPCPPAASEARNKRYLPPPVATRHPRELIRVSRTDGRLRNGRRNVRVIHRSSDSQTAVWRRPKCREGGRDPSIKTQGNFPQTPINLIDD